MNKQSQSDSYAKAGVDITAGYKAVELMKKHIARTMTGGNADDIGGFGGLFALDLTGYKKPVLVSGTDGVGTKLKLAFLMDKHDTVGIDCVAMCVTMLFAVAQSPYFSLTISRAERTSPKKSPISLAVLRKVAFNRVANLSVAKPLKCPVSILSTNTTLPVFRWVSSTATK